MDRKTRKDLKSDKFAQEVTHTFEFVSEHRNEVVRYGAIALGVIALAAIIFFYIRHRSCDLGNEIGSNCRWCILGGLVGREEIVRAATIIRLTNKGRRFEGARPWREHSDRKKQSSARRGW